MKTKYHFLFTFIFLWVTIFSVQAQYFGQNKPRYESFDFEVLQSPHFDVYHYLQNDDLSKELAKQSERWYNMHQSILQDTFSSRNPIIFYNNHPDFQQTNTISGNVSSGVGGVTEALKNRVVMPLAMSAGQTHHVLGHELVHAFQFNMILNGDSTSIRNLQNLPLWMIEGMAEYLSIGRVDAHTAMWMRDAVLNDDVPTIKQLNNPKYFPYRYGQAFWAFLTGAYGDQVIRPFFMETAKVGMDQAAKRVLNTDLKTLSGMWVTSLKTHYGAMIGGRKANPIGRKLISEDNAGRMNISPVLSPNGRYVIFFSEKDLFSIDLFLADARTGKIIRKVASTINEGHIDDFSMMESAGTWSPDSKSFAIVAVKKGQNILLIKDIEKGKTIKELTLEGVPAFSNLAWSPDKKHILVTGLVQGQTDLYQVNIKTGKVEQLTDSPYAKMQPQWSDDGARIIYATDQLSKKRGAKYGRWNYNLAILDVDKRTTGQLNVFPGADNLNPVFDNQGDVFFLSNRDGYRNMYKYEVTTGKTFQMTDLVTGISGITPYSSALTINGKRDRILYAYYLKNKYSIYQTYPDKLLNKEVPNDEVDMTAAVLPVTGMGKYDVVNTQLNNLERLPMISSEALSTAEYKPKFKLDYVGGGAGVGVGANTGFGTTTGLAGGVDMLFSDILGDNQLYTGLSLNGEILDLGGQIQYLNRKNRIAWGGRLSHTPFRTGSQFYAGLETLEIRPGEGILAQKINTDLVRIFQDQAGVFGQLPLSKSQRLEVGANITRYSFRVDRYENYYDQFGRFIARERERLEAPDGFTLGSISTALVGDNSVFGLTSPLAGYRYRIGAEQFFGELNFTRVTVDARKYVRLKPVSLAFRALHWGNYGSDADQFANNQFIGNPIFVRGYNIRSFEQLEAWNLNINDLTGNKLLVSNFEIRLPLTGPERLSSFKSKFLFTELALFADGGVAFNEFSQFGDGTDSRFGKAQPVFSAGAALRVNLFGAMILEPFYAFPIQKNTRGVFGLNIIPGW